MAIGVLAEDVNSDKAVANKGHGTTPDPNEQINGA